MVGLNSRGLGRPAPSGFRGVAWKPSLVELSSRGEGRKESLGMAELNFFPHACEKGGNLSRQTQTDLGTAQKMSSLIGIRPSPSTHKVMPVLNPFSEWEFFRMSPLVLNRREKHLVFPDLVIIQR